SAVVRRFGHGQNVERLPSVEKNGAYLDMGVLTADGADDDYEPTCCHIQKTGLDRFGSRARHSNRSHFRASSPAYRHEFRSSLDSRHTRSHREACGSLASECLFCLESLLRAYRRLRRKSAVEARG